MGVLGVFFNNQIVIERRFSLMISESERISDPTIPERLPVKAFETPKLMVMGDFCLTPIRCLFDGNIVTISTGYDEVFVDHIKEYGRFGLKRNFLRIAVSIILLIPGIIFGTIFKGLGYLSAENRKNFRLALEHHTPIDRTIGSENERLNKQAIRNMLGEIFCKNHLNRSTNNLVIYAQKGTRFNTDPGFICLRPEKIILIGAKIVHMPCTPDDWSRLDNELCAEGFEHTFVRSIGVNAEPETNTLVDQYPMRTLRQALEDVLPKKSFFSSKCVKRVYRVLSD